jgi:hypothetical protein
VLGIANGRSLMRGFLSQTQLLSTKGKGKLYPFLLAVNNHQQEFCSMGNVFKAN